MCYSGHEKGAGGSKLCQEWRNENASPHTTKMTKEDQAKKVTCSSCGELETYSTAMEEWWTITKECEPWHVLCYYCQDRFDAAMAAD